MKDPRFVSWIEKCQVCFKNKDLLSVVFSSLFSHSSGKKHKEAIWSLGSSVTTETFLEPAKTVSYFEEKAIQKNVPDSNTLDHYVQQQQVRIAEILWTLRVVMSKISLHSCEQLKCLNSTIVSNSRLPESFQIGKTNVAII